MVSLLQSIGNVLRGWIVVAVLTRVHVFSGHGSSRTCHPVRVLLLAVQKEHRRCRCQQWQEQFPGRHQLDGKTCCLVDEGSMLMRLERST